MADTPLEWLESVPLPLGIVKRGVVIFANDALLAMIARTRAEVVGMRFIDFCAPGDRAWVEDRYRRRLAGEPVPDNYDLDVLRSDGTIVPTEVWLQGDRASDTVLCQLCDRTERRERAYLLHELVQLGASLQAELSDEGIYGTLTDGLERLNVGWAFVAPHYGKWLILASGGPGNTAYSEAIASLGVHPGEFSGIDPTGKLQLAWERGVAIEDDIPGAMGMMVPGAAGKLLHEKLAGLGVMRGALLRIDRGTERLRVLVIAGTWIHEEDLPALRLFAAQISSALDAARVIGNLSARNEALAALNRVAAAAGGEDEIGQLFRVGAEELLHAMRGQAFTVHLIDESGRKAKLAYEVGLPPSAVPLLTALLGYYPGDRLGFGGREARRLMADWLVMARENRYSASGMEAEDLEGRVRSDDCPVLSVYCDRDDLAPLSAIEGVTRRLDRRRIETFEISSDALGVRADHLSWARHPAVAAATIARWIADRTKR